MKLFVSYNRQDQQTVKAVFAALKALRPGYDIFFDQHSITAGSFWIPRLHAEIERADAFLFLFGDKLGDWQSLEYYGAFNRRANKTDLPICPVLMGNAGAPGLPFFNQLNWLKSDAPASPETIGQIVRALEGAAGPSEQKLWQLVNPYRGLHALREQDSAWLYGRDALLEQLLERLGDDRRKLTIAVGNSGVGKSSLVYAGVFSTLAQQRWRNSQTPWPQALRDSRTWLRLSFKPMENPLAELAGAFVAQWRDIKTADFARDTEKWAERLAEAKRPIEDLIRAADGWAEQQGLPPPGRYLLYLDQAEELYTRADKTAARRLSEILAQAASHERLQVIMSMRADFYGRLQDDGALFAASEKVDVPKLDAAGFRDVVTGPAKDLDANFEEGFAEVLAEAASNQPSGLPLLSYQLDETWRDMVKRADGILRWPPRRDSGFDLARALVDQADGYLKKHPEHEDAVRRLFCVRLAYVPEQGQPTRRIALQSELKDDEAAIAQDLASPDYRLLAAGETDDGKASIEIGHEVLLSAWARLKNWLADRRSFYAWRTRLESDRRDWEKAGRPEDGFLAGRALEIARGHRAAFGSDIPATDEIFIELSERALEQQAEAHRRAERERIAEKELQLAAVAEAQQLADRRLAEREAEARRRVFFSRAAMLAAATVVLGLLVWMNQRFLAQEWFRWAHISPLSIDAERALKAGDTFRECEGEREDAGDEVVYSGYSVYCPQMIVLPVGEFPMGTPEVELTTIPAIEKSHLDNERPQHKVSIVQRFAVSKFAVTAEQHRMCIDNGGCVGGGGTGKEPVTSVSWDDAQRYVQWLSMHTGKNYRLLSEAEWEYAARAGTTTTYYWGADVGSGNANCAGCGSPWDNKRISPVGSFTANAFGLYDMFGNVWQWVADCWHDSHAGAPTDGTARSVGDNCDSRVVRGGAWDDPPHILRSANRGKASHTARSDDVGIRLGRTLTQ